MHVEDVEVQDQWERPRKEEDQNKVTENDIHPRKKHSYGERLFRMFSSAIFVKIM